MHCPQCGQQQVSDDVRFCSRCGLPLTSVAEVVRSGGLLPQSQLQPQIIEPTKPSPRRKGVQQGVMMFLLATVLVPMLGVLNNYYGFPPEALIGLAALAGFLGGFLRIVYALIFEEGAPKVIYVQTPTQQQIPTAYQPPVQHPSIGSTFTGAALPPMQSQPVSSWRNANTSEVVAPPSVTEGATRILDKEKLPQD